MLTQWEYQFGVHLRQVLTCASRPTLRHVQCGRREKVIGRMINQTRLKNFRNRPRHKYGHQVPRDHDEAVLIDEREGNTKWQDSEVLEINQLLECDTTKSLGIGAPIPEGHTQIPCHIACDVKWDGRHKSRLVAGGHQTDTPLELFCFSEHA